jgi:hypothetical protein
MKCIAVCFLALVVMLAAGCNGSTKRAAASAPPRAAPISNTDPCANRLHDLCGPLLLYYAVHHRLPPTLKDLADEYDVGDLTCPVSHLPYVYDLAGKRGSDPRMRVIIYDATPVHSGFRWGVGLEEAEEGVAPVAKVVALPASAFKK